MCKSEKMNIRRRKLFTVGFVTISATAGCIQVNLEENEITPDSDYIEHVEFKDRRFVLLEPTSYINLKVHGDFNETADGIVILNDGEQDDTSKIPTGETRASLDTYASNISEIELLIVAGGEFRRQRTGLTRKSQAHAGGEILERIDLSEYQ